MCCHFRAVTPEQLQELIRSPDRVDSVLPWGDNPPADPADSLDIDKLWHAIHYLLTGERYDGEPPLCDAVLGGEEIGDDGGYGPARFLLPAEVRDVAGALAAVEPEQLRERYGDGTPLIEADIYPQIWDRGPDELDYVMNYFTELVAFYRRAADSGRALLLFLI